MDRPLRFTKNVLAKDHYWIKGFTQEFINKINLDKNLSDAELLAPLLCEWDKEGDQVAIDLYLKLGLEKGHLSLINYLNHNPFPIEEESVWQQFFSKIVLEPQWLDKDKLKLGSEFCQRTGITSFIVLRDYCLMGSFLTPALYKHFFYLGDLKQNILKTISNNVEFWVQTTRKDGLQLGREGLKQIFLMRLERSFHRISILDETDYDPHQWGIPMNNWDQLATNLGYSLLYLIGLRKIGVNATAEESNGLFHLWKYIGYLSGIPTDLLPNTEDEAMHALYLWMVTQPNPDEDSITLATLLLNEPLFSSFPNDPFSKKLMREVHLYYNHYLLGEFSCQQLDLPKTTIGKFGLAHIWNTKHAEEKLIDEQSRSLAIYNGQLEQERIRNIYHENS